MNSHWSAAALLACLATGVASGQPRGGGGSAYHGGGGGGYRGGGASYHGGGGSYHGGGYGNYGGGYGNYGGSRVGVSIGIGGIGGIGGYRGLGYGGGFGYPYGGYGYTGIRIGGYGYGGGYGYSVPLGVPAYVATPAPLAIPVYADPGVSAYVTPSLDPVLPALPAAAIPAANAPTGNAAVVTVRVPDPEAEVWFGSALTTTKGAERVFRSPPLVPGQSYSYTLKARWTSNGQAVEQSRTVAVRASETVAVDFTSDPAERVPPPIPTPPGEPAP